MKKSLVIAFLITLSILIGLCVSFFIHRAQLTLLYWWLWIASILLLATPAVSLTWAALARSLNNKQTQEKRPFLYVLGLMFGSPQRGLGLICFLGGVGWIIISLTGLVRMGTAPMIFSFILVILGLSWIINAIYYKQMHKKKT